MTAWLQSMGIHPEAESALEITLKLLAALALSGMVGLERQRRGRAAGLRTHILVCLGATSLMIVSEYFGRMDGGSLDRARIAAGIITGIGFLGAGTIMKAGQEKVGLTTAATLWFSAALGIALGAGYLLTGLISTVFVLGTVIGLAAVEQKLPQRGDFTLTLQLAANGAQLRQIVSDIESIGTFSVATTSVKIFDQGGRTQIILQIHSESPTDFPYLSELVQERFSRAESIRLERNIST